MFFVTVFVCGLMGLCIWLVSWVLGAYGDTAGFFTGVGLMLTWVVLFYGTIIDDHSNPDHSNPEEVKKRVDEFNANWDSDAPDRYDEARRLWAAYADEIGAGGNRYDGYNYPWNDEYIGHLFRGIGRKLCREHEYVEDPCSNI